MVKFKKCLKCQKKVSKNCHLGHCNNCRDRSGNKNPFYGKKHNREMIEKTKRKLSLISKNKWQNKEYREKVVRGVSKPRRKSFGIQQSERIKNWYRDNPEQRNIRSQKMKKSWIDGKIEPNINSINESKLEKEFRTELKKKLDGRKVKKLTLKIGNKWFYPDVKIDKDILVEFYGNYWHANPKMFKPEDVVHHNLTAKQIWEKDRERIEILKTNGFKVFIVWQSEYQRNKEKVIQTLINSF